MPKRNEKPKRRQVLITPESRELLGQIAAAEGRTLKGQLTRIIRDAAAERSMHVDRHSDEFRCTEPEKH